LNCDSHADGKNRGRRERRGPACGRRGGRKERVVRSKRGKVTGLPARKADPTATRTGITATTADPTATATRTAEHGEESRTAAPTVVYTGEDVRSTALTAGYTGEDVRSTPPERQRRRRKGEGGD
jgi:hypothetical protein